MSILLCFVGVGTLAFLIFLVLLGGCRASVR